MATAHDKETVIRAIRGMGEFTPADSGKDASSFGNITAIARRLSVERQTIYSYMKRWAAVRQAIDDEREKRKDFVEDRMMKRIMAGSDTMIIFFAKTQMKDRGYIERTELTGADGGPVETKDASERSARADAAHIAEVLAILGEIQSGEDNGDAAPHLE